MYDVINIKLEEAHKGVLRFHKINSMLEELFSQKDALIEKEAKLKSILKKEDIDVEKLEGKSLAHIFHSILGNLDEHLEKERQEALAAQLKYDQAIRDLDHVNNEIAKLEAEREQYKHSEETYAQLYISKKEMLLETHSKTADKILALSQQISLLKNQQKEINEAINAGNEVLSHLNNAMKSLNSAEGWGTWDLLGGGLLTDMAKHSDIDEAMVEVEESQNALSKFRTELADIKITNTINIEIDGFAKFADFFFDGLIADWHMQSKINDSQESVGQTRGEVEQIIDKLRRMEKEEATQVEDLQRRMSELVESTQ